MQTNTQTDKRYSICIGINEYERKAQLSTLEYAENDAHDMDELLGKLGFVEENRRLLLGKDAAFAAVISALEDIITALACRGQIEDAQSVAGEIIRWWQTIPVSE